MSCPGRRRLAPGESPAREDGERGALPFQRTRDRLNESATREPGTSGTRDPIPNDSEAR